MKILFVLLIIMVCGCENTSKTQEDIQVIASTSFGKWQAEQVAYGDCQPDFFHQTHCLNSDELLFFTYRNAKQHLMGFSICDKESGKQVNGLIAKG